MQYEVGLLMLLLGYGLALRRCDSCIPDVDYAVCMNDYTLKIKVLSHTMTNWLAVDSVLEYENVKPDEVEDYLKNTNAGRTYDRILSRHRYEIDVLEVYRMFVDYQGEVSELETFADPGSPGIPLEVSKTYIVSSLFGMDPAVSTRLDLNRCGGFAIEVGTADVREAHVMNVVTGQILLTKGYDVSFVGQMNSTKKDSKLVLFNKEVGDHHVHFFFNLPKMYSFSA